jgi:hypothetical protein
MITAEKTSPVEFLLRVMPVLSAVLLWLLSLSANAQVQTGEPPPVGLLGWGLWILGFVVIWGLFYLGLYRLLLRHFHPRYSESLFWPILLIFLTTWLHLGSLLVLGGRFYLWGGWPTAVVAGALAFVWLVLVTLRRA